MANSTINHEILHRGKFNCLSIDILWEKRYHSLKGGDNVIKICANQGFIPMCNSCCHKGKNLTAKKICFFCIFLLLFHFSLDAFSQQWDYYNIKNASDENLLLTVNFTNRGGLGVLTRGRRLFKVPFFIQDPNPHLTPFPLFTCYPESEWGIGSDGEYRWLYNQTRSAKEIVNIFISQLIILDQENNIVLTLEDIQEEHFEYTDSRRLSPCIMVTQEMVDAGRVKYAGIVME